MSGESEERVPPAGLPPGDPGWFLRVFAGSRFFVALAVLGSFLSAIVLFVYGTLVVVRIIFDTIAHRDISVDGAKLLQVAFIQLTDVFLLGTILVVVAFGLYQLFLQPNLPVPPWLKIDNLDQLSEKLIEVVGLLLGVSFLAYAVETRLGAASVLELGLTTAATIVALSVLLFVSHHVQRDGAQEDETNRPSGA